MSMPVSSGKPENYIDGAWTPPQGGQAYQRVSPIDGATALGDFAQSTPHDVEAAIGAAQVALGDWSTLPLAARARILSRCARNLEVRAGELALRMSVETGKPLRESGPEVHRGAAVLDYFAGEAHRPVGELFQQSASTNPVFTVHRPVGVIAVVTPWNFPVAIPIWKLAPALLYGNTVVFKPSEESPWTAQALVECWAEAGLPPGVLNMVGGDGSVGKLLVEHSAVAAVSFTGSSEVGNAIRTTCSAAGRRVQLELGGQNALIVASGADLERAGEAAYAGAFFSAGQKCTATRRIFVHHSRLDEFRTVLVRRMESGHVGDPRDPKTEVGPLVNARQFAGVKSGLEQGLQDGARIVSQSATPDRGCFFGPTLVEGARDDSFLAQEEVFGPVVSLFGFDDLDDAISRANDVRQGLSMSLFTPNLADVALFTRRAQAGVLHVNSPTTGTEVHVPFGGIKASGWGPHEQGRAARDFYTESITVYQDA